MSSKTASPNVGSTKSAPFCVICLRERSANGEFYLLCNVTNSTKICEIMNDVVGFEFDSEDFTVCTPCWGLVQLLDEFRTCCLQANIKGKEISKGFKFEDDWYSEGNVMAIENVRVAIQRHLDNIEESNVSEDEREPETPAKEPAEDVIELEDSDDDDVILDEAGSEATSTSATNNGTDQIHEKARSDAEHFEASGSIMECEKCRNWFMSAAQLENHIPNCVGPKKPIEVGPPVYSCHLCPEKFNRSYLLESHVNQHEGKTPYQCRVKCQESFHGVELRYMHERTCREKPRRNLKRSSPSQSVECEKCQKKFTAVYSLKRHNQRHHADDPEMFICKVCGLRLARQNLLDEHMERHEWDDGFCKLCKIKLPNGQALRDHIRIVHFDAELMCRICGRMYTSEGRDIYNHYVRLHPTHIPDKLKNYAKNNVDEV